MEEQIQVQCKYDEMVRLSELRPHPKNRNLHPPAQIERLAKLLRYQGQRAPVIVSKLSGCIVKGHGTVEAMEKAGAEAAAVVFQDFKDSDQEYAFLTSDNAIAEWADLDLSGINLDMDSLGPELDIDMLGIKDFKVDFSEKQVSFGAKELDASEFDGFQHKCPRCKFEFDSE